MDRTRDPDFARRLFGGRPEHTLALLRAAWPAAVGPEVARRTEVVALDRGVLRLKVPDAGWQRTLLRMRRDILSRLRGVAGDAAPRALGFVVGPVAETAAPALPSGRLPEPATPVPPLVADAAAAIPDAEIRARFLTAAGHYLARFRDHQASVAGPGSGPTSSAK